MKIAMLGDLALFGRFCIKQNPSVKEYLKPVRDFLLQHDIVIANLETPFSDTQIPYGAKSAYIKSNPANVDTLNYLNITHVTLANNHMGDYGPDSYNLTKKILKENGIKYFGIESKQVRIETDTAKVALLGFCSYNTNPLYMTTGNEEGVNVLDVDTVLEQMAKNSHDGYLNILSNHSGQEHIHMPSLSDINFARGLASRFDYIYYGHHPHVIQGFEKVSESLIFYSLGNFIFDDVFTEKDITKPLVEMTDANKTGLIASVVVDGCSVVETNTTPLFLDFDKIKIGKLVPNFNMQDYNSYLDFKDSDKYEEVRTKQISRFLISRKARRNLQWYLKRLNLTSVKLIINSRRNSKLYQKHFERKLNKL